MKRNPINQVRTMKTVPTAIFLEILRIWTINHHSGIKCLDIIEHELIETKVEKREREREREFLYTDWWLMYFFYYLPSETNPCCMCLPYYRPQKSAAFEGCGKRGLGARLAAWRSCDCWCRRGWVVWMRWLVCWLFFSKGIKHSLGPVHLLFLNTILWSTIYTVQLSQ